MFSVMLQCYSAVLNTGMTVLDDESFNAAYINVYEVFPFPMHMKD